MIILASNNMVILRKLYGNSNIILGMVVRSFGIAIPSPVGSPTTTVLPCS